MPTPLLLITTCNDPAMTSLRLPTTVHDCATIYHDITCWPHINRALFCHDQLILICSLGPSSQNIAGSIRTTFSLMSWPYWPYMYRGSTQGFTQNLLLRCIWTSWVMAISCSAASPYSKWVDEWPIYGEVIVSSLISSALLQDSSEKVAECNFIICLALLYHTSWWIVGMLFSVV